MAKRTSKNTDFLSLAKETTSPKIYPLLVKLVNEDREDLAALITKIDYLLEYTSKAIKARDYREAKASIKAVEDRINILEKENVDVEYIKYLYEGINKKIK